MKSGLVFLVIAAALVGVPPPHSFAAQPCKPVVGHFEALLVPPGEGHCPAPTPEIPEPLCTAGRVWGGIQGTYRFVATSLASAARLDVPTIFFFTGDSTISLKSGDTLFGIDTGTIDLPPGLGGFASLITFNDGTGAMTGATGQIRLRGELNVSENTTSGDYIGTLCTP
jgi:hypothetical protein